MSEIVKICKVHGELTEKDCTLISPSKKYLRCKKCKYEGTNAWRKDNREKLNAICRLYAKKNRKKISLKDKIYRKKNKEKYQEYQNKWRKKNPEKVNRAESKRAKKQSENLTDNYIKRRLYNSRFKLSATLIPKDLINLKRTLILIKRKTKEIKNENK
jgi:hypothetical protein